MKFKKFNPKKYFITFHSRLKNNCAEWYFGNVCNLNCSYCFDKNTRKQYWKTMDKDETDKTIKFINSIHHLQNVTIIGGEPLCFPYIFYSIEKIKPNCLIQIMTNGTDLGKVKKIVEMANPQKPISIWVSLHSEYYLKNKEKRTQEISQLIEMGKLNKYCTIGFHVLLDKKETKKYKDIIETIYYCGKKKDYVDLSISFVKRTGTKKEVVENILALEYFDDEIKTYFKKRFLKNRANALKNNECFGKKCPVFEHYFYILVDGHIKHAECKQAVITTKSIFDDDFDLEKEKRNIYCLCDKKSNCGTCDKIFGKRGKK